MSTAFHVYMQSLCLAASLLLWAVSSLFAAEEQKRYFRIDDQFQNESLDKIAFSPDGQVLSFVRKRRQSPRNALSLEDREAGDIWLQIPGQPPRNVTDGQTDRSAWWVPQWSPNGQKLAFLSSRGGNVTLWIWERASNKVRQLSIQGVDGNAVFRRMSVGRPYDWVDDERLICLVPANGSEAPPLTSEG